MEKAWEYEKEGMGMQYQYGQAAANEAQRRNMEMWNQTNYGAQRQHMEDAGLSVGLMYGGGGQGAVSQGGQATQPSGPTSNPVGMALQYKQIEQQNEAIKSQTILNQAEAAQKQAANTAEKIIKDYERSGQKLNIDEKNSLREWIYGGIKVLSTFIS